MAPALIASYRSASSSEIVSMMIFVDGTASWIAVQASMPPRLGIRTSIRTMSGRVSDAFWTASLPSLASPTTSMSGSCSSTICRPRRNRAWSSTTRTRIGSTEREPGARAGGAAWGSSVTSTSWSAGRVRALRVDHGTPGVRRQPYATRQGSARGQPDDAVVVPVPPVNDARQPRVGVAEQEEVVPDQLHLVERLRGRHGVSGMGLVPHDQRRGVVAVVRPVEHRDALVGRLGRVSVERDAPVEIGRQRRGGLGDRGRVLAAVVDAPPVVGLAQPGLELEDRRVEGGVEVGGARLGANHRPLARTGDLDPLTLRGLSWIAF